MTHPERGSAMAKKTGNTEAPALPTMTPETTDNKTDNKPTVHTPAAPVSSPPAPTAEAPGGVKLAVAIREGFAEIPAALNSSNRDATGDLKAWIKAKYPHLADSIESPSFGSTLSVMRKKQGGPGAANGTPARKSTVSNGEPTLTDLMSAKALAESLDMKPATLAELVGKLVEFGDMAGLSKCLTVLTELTGK